MVRPRCLGVSIDTFPGNRTCLYHNAIIYNGVIYVRETPQTVYVHNRWTHTFKPTDRSMLPSHVPPPRFSNLTAIVHIGFHSNMGHMLLDSYYPAWHSLAALRGYDAALYDDIQMITFWNNKWPAEVIRLISGTSHIVLSQMKDAVQYRHLILGIGGKGLCIIDKQGAVLGETRRVDLVRLFARRIYMRFDVPRRATSGVNEIVHIRSKRALDVVIDQPHTTIRWDTMSFGNQLRLMSRTRVLLVGVGTARMNTFLLPPGSVEVQTFNIVFGAQNNLQRFDDHAATLVNHVRIMCVSKYSDAEARSRRVNLTHLVADAMMSDHNDHNWRTHNSKCYHSARDPLARSGWPPRSTACRQTCPSGLPFAANVRNSNN